MSVYFIKQPSSRPILTTTSTSVPIKAGAETYQIRVVNGSSVVANITIADSSAGSGSTGVTVPIWGGTAGSQAEYFAITPGQWYSLSPGFTVTEMS